MSLPSDVPPARAPGHGPLRPSRAPRGTAARAALLALVLPLTAGACSGPAADPDAPPSAQPSRPETGLPASGTPGAAGLDGLAPDVRACLSPNALDLGRGQTFYEVGRAQGSAGEYVHVYMGDPGATSGFKDALLLFRDGTCTSLLDHGGEFYTFEEAAPPDVEDALSEATLDWLVAQAGGPDAYAERVLREQGRRAVCTGTDESLWTDCVEPREAERLRERGLSRLIENG